MHSKVWFKNWPYFADLGDFLNKFGIYFGPFCIQLILLNNFDVFEDRSFSKYRVSLVL